MFINKRSCLNSQVTFIYVIRIRICIMYEWKMSKTCRTAVKLIFEFPSVYIGTRIIYILLIISTELLSRASEYESRIMYDFQRALL